MPRTRIITRSKPYNTNATEHQQGLNKNIGQPTSSSKYFYSPVNTINGYGQHSNTPDTPPSSSTRWGPPDRESTKENNNALQSNQQVTRQDVTDTSRDQATPAKPSRRSRRRANKLKHGSTLNTDSPLEPMSSDDYSNTYDIIGSIRDGERNDECPNTNSSVTARLRQIQYSSSGPSSSLSSNHQTKENSQRRDVGFAKQISNILKSQSNQKLSSKSNIVDDKHSIQGDLFYDKKKIVAVGTTTNIEKVNDESSPIQNVKDSSDPFRQETSPNDRDVQLSTNDENYYNSVPDEKFPSPLESTVTITKRKRRRPRRHAKRQAGSEAASSEIADTPQQQSCNYATASEAGDSGFDVSSQCSTVSGSSSSIKESNGGSPSRSSSGSRSSSSPTNLILSGLDPENIPFYFKEPDIEDYPNPFEQNGMCFYSGNIDSGNGLFGDGDGDADSICSWSEIENFDDFQYGALDNCSVNSKDDDGDSDCGAAREEYGRDVEEDSKQNCDISGEELNSLGSSKDDVEYDETNKDNCASVIPQMPTIDGCDADYDDDGNSIDVKEYDIQIEVTNEFYPGADLISKDNTEDTDGDEQATDSGSTKDEETEEDPLVEIDYDKYLPSNILMHVKRDLVSILMEYGQTREVKVAFDEMERTGPHHASRFFTSAIVDSETFPVGCGSSKKNAKKAAAAFALKIMYDRGKQNLRMVNESAVLLASRHALEVCQETQFINYSKEKIVATIVLELHGKMKVVALGTGNRCILYPNLTKDGNKIIHAHAEVIARRAFIRYLYKQLLLFNPGRNHPIFTRSDSGKLKLRDKIQVHLYISRPPCGDAAAFPTIGNHPNKMRAVRKQGQLRTIIDDGEGAIPTEFYVPPGPNGKERLRIMTCSDKICRWNALGVQGALLSHFIDPIYINTLVIGSHTGDQRGHLPRAISGRIKCGRLHEVIQRPYRINSPEIQYPHDDLCDIYTINKSKQYFITWSYGDEDTEVIDAITGITNMEPMDEPQISRVCKRSLHQLFLELCAKSGRTDLMTMDYNTAKRCATTYQRMKNFVGQHLAVMGFGHWYSLQETYGTDDFTSGITTTTTINNPNENDNNNDCPTSC